MRILYPEYLDCEECKVPIHVSDVRMAFGNIEVCINCFIKSIEHYTKVSGLGGTQPFVLKAILENCFDRKKRIPIPKKIRQAVFLKYKHTCTYCGSKNNLEIDHKHPYSKGGNNDISNLQVLCKGCNVKKSNKISNG